MEDSRPLVPAMRLTELEPQWLSENLFVFRCPHCREIWISCKNIAMIYSKQTELFRKADLDPHGPYYAVVPMREETAWNISSKDFQTMSVTPSIDASASGHWHGHITNGEIK